MLAMPISRIFPSDGSRRGVNRVMLARRTLDDRVGELSVRNDKRNAAEGADARGNVLDDRGGRVGHVGPESVAKLVQGIAGEAGAEGDVLAVAGELFVN